MSICDFDRDRRVSAPRRILRILLGEEMPDANEHGRSDTDRDGTRALRIRAFMISMKLGGAQGVAASWVQEYGSEDGEYVCRLIAITSVFSIFRGTLSELWVHATIVGSEVKTYTRHRTHRRLRV